LSAKLSLPKGICSKEMYSSISKGKNFGAGEQRIWYYSK